MNALGQYFAKYFAEQREESVRWTVCFAVVVLLHVAVGFGLRQYAEAFGLSNEDDLTVMLELPELPQQQVEEQKEEPPPPQEEEKPPEPEDVAMPTPEPPPPEEKPVTPPPVQLPLKLINTWQGRLAAHIERFRRYREYGGEVGLAKVAFTIDHDGHLLASRIAQSSGSTSLDQEALAMLARADPMPKPPEGTPDSSLSMVVPVRFY